MDDINFPASGFKCHFCSFCDGTGCIGEIPGMGGNHNNENFRLNCDGWEVVRKKLLSKDSSSFDSFQDVSQSIISLAPISGAVENVGYSEESSFYKDIIFASHYARIDISIGDGCPDIKIQSAIEAVKNLKKIDSDANANVFIKPYENEKIFERMEWAESVSKVFGVDIDSFNIATMKRQVILEKKSSLQLQELKKRSNSFSKPFAVKGVFTESDLDLVKEVLPDIVYISNHGGRIETRTGSTAEYFYNYADILKNYCSEIWVDGGIRTKADLETAVALGAKKILLGRPIITALCDGLLKGTDIKENVSEAVIRLVS